MQALRNLETENHLSQPIAQSFVAWIGFWYISHRETASIELYPSFLDERSPIFVLIGNQGPKFNGGRSKWLETENGQPLLNVAHRQYRGNLMVKSRYQLRWRLFRCDQTNPRFAPNIGKPGFRGGLNVRKFRFARASGHGEHLDGSGLGMRRYHWRRIDEKLYIAAHDPSQSLRAGPERDDHDIDPSGAYEQAGDQSGRRPIAGRAYRQHSGFRLRQRDEFRKRICRHPGMRPNRHRPGNHRANRFQIA